MRELRVDGCKNLLRHLHHGHLETAMNEVFGHLQPDKAAAHDDRTRARSGGQAGTARNPFVDSARIGNGADMEDAGQIDPRQGRPHGSCAGR